MRKNVTLAKVAQDSGVSIATVCKVLNPGNDDYRVSARCSQRVLDSAKRLGYTPNYHAQAMKHGKSGVIGFALDIFPSPSDDPASNQLGTAYFGSIFGAVEKCIRKQGYYTTVIGPEPNVSAPERGLLGIRQRRFDGMVVLGTSKVNPLNESAIGQTLFPIVLVKHAPVAHLPTLDWDEPAAVALAVKHLAELGHRELLWVGPAGDKHREPLFVTAAWEAGLRGASCHVNGDFTIYMPLSVDPVAETLRAYLAQAGRRFTGIVCFNDVVAVGVWKALQSSGARIPEDVSIVGIDDVIAWFAPMGLTSVSQKLAHLGRRSAEIVMEMLRDEEACKRYRGVHEVVQPQLTIRGSTGRAP